MKPKPWEKDEDGLYVFEDPEIEGIIKSNHLKLRRSLQLSEAFWAAAVEEDLISNSAINNIKVEFNLKTWCMGLDKACLVTFTTSMFSNHYEPI